MNRSGQDFEAFFEQTYADVVRFAVRRVGRESAEDIAAEAFAIAWRRRDALPWARSERRAWVFGIARNVMLAQMRRARRGPLPVLAEAPEQSDGHRVDESVVELDLLQRAWRMLDDSEQEVLALAAWDQLGSREAGAVLGISAGAYRIRLSRARATLRALVSDIETTKPSPSSTALRSNR